MIKRVWAEMRPGEILPASVYLYLPLNDRFLCLKGPLGFFTESEITKFKTREEYFLPKSAESTEKFRLAGKKIKEFLSTAFNPSDELPLATYEIADHVFEEVSQFWGETLSVSAFDLVFFSQEIVETWAVEELCKLQDQNIEEYEKKLLQAGAGIFLALHLGAWDVSELDRLAKVILGFTTEFPTEPELAQLARALPGWIPSVEDPILSLDSFRELKKKSRVAAKISGRIEKMSEEQVA